MKKYIALLLSTAFIAGCASGKPQIRSTSPDTEVVVADGMAPIVNNDLEGAKKTALHDALKNALGLVVGVYVSQEALVSKSILIEDNITSQTEGYIEKYTVQKEWRDGDFYNTRVKALVRKEDLSAKLKALELEPKKLGNPIVNFAVDDLVDGNLAETQNAEAELKNAFTAKGYVVSESTACDILVTGRAEASFNTDQGLGGLVSYRAAITLKAVKQGSEDVITSFSQTVGGIDTTRETAAKAAIIAAAKKAAGLPDTVTRYLKEKSTLLLTLSNVDDYNTLNRFLLSLRAQVEVRDCKVRDFSNNTALIDVDVKKGTTGDVAKRLEQLTSFKVRINGQQAYTISAELLK
jgi:hypothetical protein